MSPANGNIVPRTIAEVMAKRDAALQEIDAKAGLLEDQKREILARARKDNRELTPKEAADFASLNNAIDALSSARVEIKLVAVDEAIQSQEARGLADSLQQVNNKLKQQLDRVAGISQKLKKIGEVFATIQSVVSGLTRLAKLI